MNQPPSTRLVLLRHGQSVWNRQHRLTGWSDVGLTAHGEQQARTAARTLAEAGFGFDVAYTSVLHRAADTLDIVLATLGATVEVHRCWELNERHYGALEGLGPVEAVLRFGIRRVVACQRRFDVLPPPVPADDPRHLANLERYGAIPPEQVPRAETMADALVRMTPVWTGRIAPAVRAGQRVLVVGHKNILRALIKTIEDLAPAEVERLPFRTGEALVYEFDPALTIVRRTIVGKS